MQGHDAHAERTRNFALQFPLRRQINSLRKAWLTRDSPLPVKEAMLRDYAAWQPQFV
jgi:hypothetical protein